MNNVMRRATRYVMLRAQPRSEKIPRGVHTEPKKDLLLCSGWQRSVQDDKQVLRKAIRRYIPRSPDYRANRTMGKGDKRSKKGKIFRGSYGKRRPRKLKKKPAPAPKKG